MIQGIERVDEILSNKEKFLENVWSAEFNFRKIVGDSGYVNLIEFPIYVANDEGEREHFYDIYKTRGYDNFEIDSIEKDDSMWGKCTYCVEMHKKYEGYTLYATMVLYARK